MKCSGPENCFCAATNHIGGNVGSQPLTWVDVAGYYPDSRECLAAFIAASSAEVLAGVKPANLIRIVNRKLPCGRRLYRLWQKYGASIMKESVLSFAVMREEQGSVLLLLYSEKLLSQRFQSKTMQAFLQRSGCSKKTTLDEALCCLSDAFKQGVPHEIGAFLGYPLKDVRGFMTRSAPPLEVGGMWRIYGSSTRSLRLDGLFKRKRQEMMMRLSQRMSPMSLLGAA